MTKELPTFPEDDEILAQLDDPMDVEAFSNLMDNAHQDKVSAADFIREEPKRTSRRAIRHLCLKDQKRSLKAVVSSVVRSLWDRPPEDPAAALNTMFGQQGPSFGPPGKHETGSSPRDGQE